MKRFLALFLTVMLLASVVPMSVFALEAQPVSQAVNIDSSIAVYNESRVSYGTAGQTIRVNVDISDNPGIFSAEMTFSFHQDLTLIGATVGEQFASFTCTPPSGFEKDPLDPTVFTGNKTGSCNFTLFHNDTSNANGTLLTLTFQIADTAQTWSSLDISLDFFAESAGDDYSASTTFRTTVIDYMPGDVNGDARVTLLDVILISQYIADGRTYDPDGYAVQLDENAANVSGDQNITLRDAVLISQYIADSRTYDPDGYGVIFQVTLPSCQHALSATEAKEATCEEDGNIAYWYCANCECYFSDAAATNEITWAQTVLAAPGHTVVIDEAVEPTPQQPGLTEGSHCSVCQKVLIEQQEIPYVPEQYYITYISTKGGGSVTGEYHNKGEGFYLPQEFENAPAGYKFEGWYTKPEDGEKIVYLEPTQTENITVYAHWSLITYDIYCYDAPEHSIRATYTVEDEFPLLDPTWPGDYMIFKYWTVGQPEDKDREPIDRIKKGTTGELHLTAVWRTTRNVVTLPEGESEFTAVYDEESGKYYFVQEIGTVEHVILTKSSASSLDPSLKYLDKGMTHTFTLSKTVHINEATAGSISTMLAESTFHSEEYKTVENWATENSSTHNWNVSAEVSLPIKVVKVGVKASGGGEYYDEKTWGKENTSYVRDDLGTETQQTVSSSFYYQKEITETIEETYTFTAPVAGYYDYVNTGNITVFAVVCYDPVDGNYTVSSFSTCGNMHTKFMYYRNENDIQNMNDVRDELAYNISTEKIEAYLDNSYSVNYDANGGEGTMFSSCFEMNKEGTLLSNEFNRKGYAFAGWSLTSDGEVIYQDQATVLNLAQAKSAVTLYAQWTSSFYTVTYDANGATGSMTTPINFAWNTATTLEKNGFVRNGYDFKGWALTPNGTVAYNDEAEVYNAVNPGETLTLYAVWEVNVAEIGKYAENGLEYSDTHGANSYIVYNDITKTPQLTGGAKKYIVYWANYSGEHDYPQGVLDADGNRYGGGNTNLDICYAEEVYFFGNEYATYCNLAIYAVNYTGGKLTLHFHNFNMKGLVVGWNSPAPFELVLDYHGNNTITSTTTNYAAIRDLDYLTITGDGTITVNGCDGPTGSHGGLGIYVNNLTVSMDTNGKLYVYGGDGGDGANGSGVGAHGGNAGGGNTGIYVGNLVINSGNVYAYSGNGGRGGDGTAGASYGNYPKDGTDLPTGGNGGNGGNGGGVARALVATDSVYVGADGKLEIISGTAGNGGNGGSGGAGGNSGNWYTSGGYNGNGGNGGDGGLTEATTSIDYLNLVSETVSSNITIHQITTSSGGNGGAGGYGGACHSGGMFGNYTTHPQGANGINGSNGYVIVL